MAKKQELVDQNDKVATWLPVELRMPRRDTRVQDYPASFDTKTFQGRAMLLNAAGSGDIQFGADGNARITACNWCILWDESTDETTGEVSEFTRLVLFDKDGRTLSTTSAVAPRRMQRILQAFNKEEWEKGLPLVLIEKKTRDGKRTYHDLKVDLSQRV